jgi:hypothetical protein
MNSSGEHKEGADPTISYKPPPVASNQTYDYSADESFLRSDLEKLRNRLVLAIGNGLFDGVTPPGKEGEPSESEEIYSHLYEAEWRLRRSVENETPEERAKRFIEAKEYRDKAQYKFLRAINEKSRKWRLLNIYALHLFPYVPVMLCMILILYTLQGPKNFPL